MNGGGDINGVADQYGIVALQKRKKTKGVGFFVNFELITFQKYPRMSRRVVKKKAIQQCDIKLKRYVWYSIIDSWVL